jgi:unsaturated rhamnogalacturonyl hydrolase
MKIFHFFKTTALLLSLLMFVPNCSENKRNPENSTLKNELQWSYKMVESEIKRLGNSLEYQPDNKAVKWDYETGLLLKAFMEVWEQSKNEAYFNYVKKVMDSYIESDGNMKTYKPENYNIDNINPGKVVLWLYRITGDEKYRKAAALLREQLQNHPRTKEGGFWHKKIYPWQMWLDGIYMGAPFYAEYSVLFNNAQGFEDIANQISLIDVHTRDPKTGLRYHGWDESNKQEWADPETGCSPNFWGRAMGWYAMALVDVLDFFPADHPKREKILFILDDLLTSLANFQDKESGLWYQVVDMADRKGNYLEASVSSMLAYAYAKAVNKKYIGEKFKSVAKKAYEGVVNSLVKVDENGQINLTQICSVAGLGGNPYRDGSFEYYISEPVEDNDSKGVGPFIMAGLQVAAFNENH